MQTSELENTVMQALLADLPPGLECLRTQYKSADVIDRDFTGVGVFTSFRIPDSVERVVPESFQLEGYLALQGVLGGATALLFVESGVICVLELVTWSGEWPENPILLSVDPQPTNRGSGP